MSVFPKSKRRMRLGLLFVIILMVASEVCGFAFEDEDNQSSLCQCNLTSSALFLLSNVPEVCLSGCQPSGDLDQDAGFEAQSAMARTKPPGSVKSKSQIKSSTQQQWVVYVYRTK